MFKIAGHTMGTPEYTVPEAIALMQQIGADGVEIVVQDNYKSGLPCDCPQEELAAVKACADAHGMEISCLTPYNSYFNALDEDLRQSEIAAIKKVISYCEVLGARYIRIYGGNQAAGDRDRLAERREKLIASMRTLGDCAATAGVTLVIENHFNTMAVSARQSAALVRDIDHPAVRILYDQANLTFTENEDHLQAIALQQPLVAYMHVKDLVFKQGVAFSSSNVARPTEEERNVYTRIVGEGIVPWPEILDLVRLHGYRGWLSLEYERRWHPADIPDASIGMKKSIAYLRSLDI